MISCARGSCVYEGLINLQKSDLIVHFSIYSFMTSSNIFVQFDSETSISDMFDILLFLTTYGCKYSSAETLETGCVSMCFTADLTI